MERVYIVDDIKEASSKATIGSSVDLPNLGLKTAQGVSQLIKRCPECGSDCLDIHIDSKGEVFLFCLRSMDMFPAYELVL